MTLGHKTRVSYSTRSMQIRAETFYDVYSDLCHPIGTLDLEISRNEV